MSSAIWGFIGTLVGALASIATTSISSWNTFRIQKLSNKEDRKERSRAFQRETLLELQEELVDYMRLFGEAYFEQLESYKKTGDWRSLLSDEINEKIRLSNAKTAVLIERLIDEEIRNNLNELKNLVSRGLLANTKEEAETYQRKASEKFEECNKSLGAVLRSYY